ncbi:MAG: hypothetical protein KKD11_08375 [Candidatus Omnitrophica bacterium]|nr:hypothetical protein [Candidatus Omnitrophota bacterium]
MRRVLFILALLLAVASLVVSYHYTTEHLGLFVARFLEENFEETISVASVGIGLPLCLELRDVKVNDSIDIRNIRLYPNPKSFLMKKDFIVSKVKVIDPVVRIKKKGRKGFQAPDFLKKGKSLGSLKGSNSNILFSKIYIKNGTLIYEYKEGQNFQLVKIKGRVNSQSLCCPGKSIFEFDASGFFKNKDSDSLAPLSLTGIAGSDDAINARLQVSDIKLASRLIKDLNVDFKSDIEISKNTLTARCFVEGENMPATGSFILLVNFKNNLIKIKNLQGNFLKHILN